MEAGLNGKKQTSWRNSNSNRLAFPAKRITRFATEWIRQVERVVPWPAVALAKATQRVGNCGWAAWNLCAKKALEKLAFGNSIVLRTRRSTLTQVYV